MDDDGTAVRFTWDLEGFDASTRRGSVEMDRIAVLTGPSSAGKSLVLEALAGTLQDPGWLRGSHRVVPRGDVVTVWRGSPAKDTKDLREVIPASGDNEWSVQGPDPRWMTRTPRERHMATRLPWALLASATRVDMDRVLTEAVLQLAEHSSPTVPGVGDTPLIVLRLLEAIESRSNELAAPFVQAEGQILLRSRVPTWRDTTEPWLRVFVEPPPAEDAKAPKPATALGSGLQRWVQIAVGLALAELTALLTRDLDARLRPPLEPHEFDGTPRPVAAIWEFSQELDAFAVHLSSYESGNPGPVAWIHATSLSEWMARLPPRDRPVLLLDEPELHLHPSAQREVATWLARLAPLFPGVIVASHSPAMMGLRADVARQYHMRRGGAVQEITEDVLGHIDKHGDELGLGRGAWLFGVSAVLLVEGEHDVQAVTRFFGTRLLSARVVVLPMRGGRSWRSVAESDFLSMAGVPLFFLFDNVRLEAVQNADDPSDLRDEEKWAWQLVRLREGGREVAVVPYADPDVMCAVPPHVYVRAYPHLKSTIHDRLGDHPNWRPLIESYRAGGETRSFKDWVFRDVFEFSKPPGQVVMRAIEAVQDSDEPTKEFAHAMRWLLASV